MALLGDKAFPSYRQYSGGLIISWCWCGCRPCCHPCPPQVRSFVEQYLTYSAVLAASQGMRELGSAGLANNATSAISYPKPFAASLVPCFAVSTPKYLSQSVPLGSKELGLAVFVGVGPGNLECGWMWLGGSTRYFVSGGLVIRCTEYFVCID